MLELLAKLRRETGHKNKRIRKQGLIPAVLYGHKVKNLTLSVKQQDFEKIYQQTGESTLIKLKIERGQDKTKSAKISQERPSSGKKERVVLIHQIDKDPVSDKPIHVDFYQVKMDQEIKAEVPLVFIGWSPAVKELDGVLVKNIQSLEIEALPAALPRQIEVDISSLKTFDDHICVKDLKIPHQVKTEARPEEVVALVIPPRTKAELDELEKAPEEKIEEVEKVEEKKAGEEKEEEPEEKAKEAKGTEE